MKASSVQLLLLLAVCRTATSAPVGFDVVPDPLPQGIDHLLAAVDSFPVPGETVPEPATVTEPSTAPAVDIQEGNVTEKTAPCLGCVREITKDSVALRAVTAQAAELLEKELGIHYMTVVTQVYRAAQQVVNGLLYYLTLELGITNCTRPAPEAAVCTPGVIPDRLLFHVELIDQPHLNNTELLLFTVADTQDVAGLPGLLAGPDPPPDVAGQAGLFAGQEQPEPEQLAAGGAATAGLEPDLAALLPDIVQATVLPPNGAAETPAEAGQKQPQTKLPNAGHPSQQPAAVIGSPGQHAATGGA